MKQVLIKAGSAAVEQVPAPQAGPRSILVRSRTSCVSVGTEMAGVRSSGESLYRRALKHPENVRKVMHRLRTEGLERTASFVKGKLAVGVPTGYSAAGVVIAVGAEVEGFAVGDRVACAGATANHAEVLDVPVNLAVAIPDSLGFADASTVTPGAIALQGVRRAAPTLGETVVVVGLGILGQITAQLLRANGCRVIGVDIAGDRIAAALHNGMDHGVDPAVESYVDRVHKLTEGFGADAVIVTAASSSNEVISQAMQACRKKGRVVLVGDVGLDLKRSDFYAKELDFLISTSYGPGRYDALYEEGGQDYPLPYVRWTENRNMAEYLRLLADGRVSLGNLSRRSFPVDDAQTAYESLKSGGAPLLVLLEYPERDGAVERRVNLPHAATRAGAVRVAVVGAGTFATNVHLPNLLTLKQDFALRAVMTRTGANARAIASQYGAAYASTDYKEVLADPEVDLVLIATRHDLHGSMAVEALRAGKHVLVEKPLTIHAADLERIAAVYADASRAPVLMTGFNRRFSPAMRRAKELLAGRTTPLIVNYRMNAGFIPPESWVHGPEGGGRNLGEACHIYDLFNFLTDARVALVQASAVQPSGRQWHRNDNFVATVSYDDGSVCTLTYTAMGHRDHPKERMEIFADGKVLLLDDFLSLEIVGMRARGWSSPVADKGQLDELRALAAALKGGPWPISLEQQLRATAIAFEVEKQLSA